MAAAATAAVQTTVLDLHAMSTRRVPLANNPNAANSPHRGIAGKRPRTLTQDGNIERQDSPARKKQAIDAGKAGMRRPLPVGIEEAEVSVSNGRYESTRANAFQRQLSAAREGRLPNSKQERAEKPFGGADVEQIKQWRRHYRKIFPTLVFYLEGMPADACLKYSRQISHLGAREEKFFSKAVTHIVTTRPIPTSPTESGSAELQDPSKPLASRNQLNTIDPTLLDKSKDSQPQPKGRQALELIAGQKRSHSQLPPNEPQRGTSNHNDVLQKARDLNIKIWAQEKFERMMTAMFNEELDDDDRPLPRAATQQITRTAKDADLSQLLKKEKYNSTVDRNPWQEIVPFRGYYIYIHDMDERNKPVMVREYTKAQRKEDGEWPQFRSCPPGRCPFLEDNSRSKRVERTEQETKQTKRDTARMPVRQTRAATATQESNVAMRDTPTDQRSALEDLNIAKGHNARGSGVPKAEVFEPPKLRGSTSTTADSMPPLFPAARPNYRGIHGKPGGEPVASGMHHHPRTSAIRSNAPSSTTNVPGRRAGTTKEMHQLQRRILDKNSGLSGSAGSSYVSEVRAAINQETTTQTKRPNRRAGAATLTLIHEDDAISEEEDAEIAALTLIKGNNAPKKKKAVRKEPKPGFCENCREKYDDFDTHILDKKHRKFAMADDNWVDLDDLLQRLHRPLKDD